MKRRLPIILLILSFGALHLQAQDQQKNDPQPRRVNYKKLTTDPSSEYYNQNIKTPKDKVSERFDYEFNRIKNPQTGRVPANIKQLELEYVHSERSKLQLNNGGLFNFRNGLNIITANGDQVTSWVNRGPFNVGGRTRALAIDLDDENILLAGGASGGMWRSVNQGASWQRVTTGDEHPTVTDVEQDPRASFHDTWYYSTGERLGASQSARNGAAFLQGNGVYKSTDNGSTWTLLTATANNTPQSFDNAFDLIFNIEVNPINGDLYVATFDGIHRSTDGGGTFTEVLAAEFDNYSDIYITSTGVIYAALDDGGGNGGIYRTTDGSSGTWTNITDSNFPTGFGRTVIYSAPSDENIVYILASGTSSAPVSHDFWKYTYVSGDGSSTGGTWEDRSANLPNFGGSVGSFNSQGGYDLYVRVHPTDPNTVFIGGTNIYRSEDAFATGSGVWIAGYSPLNNVSLYTNHHPDQHSLEFFPSDPSKVITGHDGGISITDDIMAPASGSEPVTWASLNNGYLTTQVYALSIGPNDQLMAGFQDNSTWFTNNANPNDSWVDVFSGDGSYNAFNSDGTVRYLSSQTGNIYKVRYADANTANPISFTALSPADGLFVAPFELDPNNDEIMYYAAGAFVWRNDDLTNATSSTGWTQLTNAAATTNVSMIGISTQPANTVYFGTISGEVYRIDNAHTGNPAATDIFTNKGLPAGNVSSINVNPLDANDVIITFSNYSIKSVFQTLDGGATWTNISGNIEENVDGSGNGPSVRWASRVGNNDRYFIGTSTGLYSTTTLNGTSTTWTQENMEGISNAVVEQIRVRNTDGLVVVGTHGNGLFSATYEVSQANVTAENPIANFTVAANSANTVIDVSTIFTSNTDPIQAITVTVDDNNNSGLLSANITGNNLTLSYLTDQFGEATITLKGTDESNEFATTSFKVFVTPAPVLDFPYKNDFEGGLMAGWEISGNMPWIINNGGTPSASTGPIFDHTLGNSTGKYIFCESSDPAVLNDEAILISRKIDLSTLPNPSLQFYYHMFGLTMGTLKVEVNDLTNLTTTEIFSITGQQQDNQGDDYLAVDPVGLDLSAFSGSIIEVHFIASKGTDFYSDVAIDDIEFYEAPGDDLGVVDVSISNAPFYGNSETVTASISNTGLNAQSSFELAYVVNGGTIITEVVSATIQPGETLSYDFTTKLDATALTTINIEAYTSLIGDNQPSNDTFTASFDKSIIVTSFPYTESFESGTSFWSESGINSSWQLGTPNSTSLTAAADGVNAWVTNLTGNYNNDTDAQVYSPYFDLSNFNNPIIQLDVWTKSETSYDGTIIEYTVDRGQNWFKIGDFSDPDNWYTRNEIEALNNESGWDAFSSTEWFTATHSVPGFAIDAEVGFRINFKSDGIISDEGFAFDKVNIFDLKAPVEITEVPNTSSLVVSWPAIDGAAYYELDVSNDGFSSFISGNQNLQTSDLALEVSGLAAETAYDVRIRTYATDNYVSDYLVAEVNTIPLPRATAATNISLSGFTANWEAYTAYLGATSYQIEVSDNNFISNIPGFDMLEVTGNSIAVNGLTESTNYQYRVSAIVDGNMTDPSAPISVATLSTPPNADPTNLTVSLPTSSSLKLTWNDNITNEEAYIIERKLASAANFLEIATIGGNTVTYTDTGLSPNTNYSYRVYASNNAGVSDFTNESTGLTLPNAPTATAATNITEISFVANWDSIDFDISYLLDVSIDNFTTTLVDYTAVPVTIASAKIAGLTKSTTYQFRVRAQNSAGISSNSNIIEATTLQSIPSAATTLTASVNSASVILNWTDNSDNEDSFIIERKLSSAVDFSSLATISGGITTYEDSNIVDNTSYTYRVFASNTRGNSAASNELIIKTIPAAPTATTASNVNSNSFSANWSNEGDGVTYLLDVSDDNFATTLTNYTLKSISETSNLIVGLEEVKMYQYRVLAENNGGQSSYSNIIETTTLKSIPIAPSDLTASLADGSISLSWEDNAFNEAEFRIERKTESENTYTLLATVSANTIEFSDSDVLENTSYSYKVFAVNSSGNSEFSNEVTILTLPITPTANEATEIGENSFVANWSNEGEGISYLLDVSNDNFESTLGDFNAKELTATSVLVDGLEDLETYQFRVRAKNDAGNSSYSNTIEATTLLAAPVAPTQLQYELVDTNIVLSWTDNSDNETSFRLERKLGNGQFETLATVAEAAVSYLDEIGDLKVDITYRVFAENSAGTSAASNELLIGREITSNKSEVLTDAVSVLPNPSNGYFTLNVSKNIAFKALKVLDLSGKVIISETFNDGNISTNLDEHVLDISAEQSGIYLLYLETKSGLQTVKKLVKR